MVLGSLRDKNPIRISGLIAIVLLVGPGTWAGFSMLLAHAGISVPFQAPHAATHAKLQLAGFFLILIWGFLVHGLSGMLGADTKRTRHVNPWMLATAASLLALWLADGLGAPKTLLRLIDGALLVSVSAGSAILVHAGLRGTHRWIAPPYPLLIIPLALPPVSALLWFIDTPGPRTAAAQLMLWGCITPIIIAMGYRMFSSMVRMQFPRERLFTAASAAWGSGVFLLVVSNAGLAFPEAVGRVLLALGTLGFVLALRVFEPLRTQPGKPKHIAVDASLLRHIRVAALFLLVSAAIHALLIFDGLLPGTSYYWNDVARHLLAIGFGFILVSGITQRLFPSFLRAQPSSALWMDGTLILLTLGLALRMAEPFLPATALLVTISAVLLYAGVLGYALQVALPLIGGGKLPQAARERIRKEQEVEHCSPG